MQLNPHRHLIATGKVVHESIQSGLGRLALAGFALVLLLACGCESVSQPWSGIPYSPPAPNERDGRAFYSPTPRILPGQMAERLDTRESDKEIERSLFGLTEAP